MKFFAVVLFSVVVGGLNAQLARRVYRQVDDGKYRPSDEGKYVHSEGKTITPTSGQFLRKTPTVAKATFSQQFQYEPQQKPQFRQQPIPYVQNVPSNIPVVAEGPEARAETLTRESQVNFDGYNYLYSTGNGISAKEEGHLENVGTEVETLKVNGEYQWTAPDGVLYLVRYVADENGFHPSGDHIPAVPETLAVEPEQPAPVIKRGRF